MNWQGGVILRAASASGAHALSRPPRGGTLPAPGSATDVDAGAAHRQALEAAYQDGLAQGRRAVIDEAFERECRAGYAEGRKSGEQEGRLAAQQALKEDWTKRLDALDKLLKALPGQIMQRMEAAEEDMLALAMEVAHRVLGEQAGSAVGLRGILAQALDGFDRRQLLEVRLHPADLATLDADPLFQAAFGAARQAGSVRLHADDEVVLGGCLLFSAEGSLDARLETQLAALHDTLRQQRQQRLTSLASGAQGNTP